MANLQTNRSKGFRGKSRCETLAQKFQMRIPDLKKMPFFVLHYEILCTFTTSFSCLVCLYRVRQACGTNRNSEGFPETDAARGTLRRFDFLPASSTESVRCRCSARRDKHHFAIVKQQRIERNRRFDAHAAPGHQRHRNMKSFRKWHGTGGLRVIFAAAPVINAFTQAMRARVSDTLPRPTMHHARGGVLQSLIGNYARSGCRIFLWYGEVFEQVA